MTGCSTILPTVTRSGAFAKNGTGRFTPARIRSGGIFRYTNAITGVTMDQDRIERFRALTVADPTNELGFFSLGRALIDAGQPAEAIPALQRVLALNAY